MASLLFSSSPYLTFSIPTKTLMHSRKFSSIPSSLDFSGDLCRRKVRVLTLVTRAGPSTSSYIFAFALPLSLLAITIFTSIKISDKLDRDFLEEMAINEAIREADEENDDEDIDIPLEEPAISRTRNRPKREA